MMKIWGRNNSINVQKVLWCADELGLQYERVDVGGAFGGTREAAYLKMNPNALVPTVEVDGLVLWESNTITRYLAAKHGMGKLCPADLGKRAEVERWMDWQLSALHKDMATVFWGLIRTPAEKRDPAAIAAAAKSLSELWTRLERNIEGKSFVGGSEFTMGDIPIGCMAYRWYALPIERAELPNVRAWYERLATRPAYRKNVMIPMT